MATKTDGKSYVLQLRERLITHEDPLHFHKTLGILCLLSYAFRFYHFPAMAFDTHPEWTVPTVFLHFMLPASSFIFKIPAKRIKDGSRIWPEYRLHSLIFTSRSLAIILLYWYEQGNNLEPMYWMNVVIQLVSIGLADLVSWQAGNNHSDSVRDIEELPGFLKFFFSAVQFRLAAAILLGTRQYGLQFKTVSVIQITAFTATLNRKNLVNPIYTAWFYAVQLASGIHLSFTELSPVNFVLHGAIANTVTILRMGPRLPKPLQFFHSKYVLWALVGLVLPYVRPNEDGSMPEGGPTEAQVKAYAAASMLGLAALATWKIAQYPKVKPAGKTV